MKKDIHPTYYPEAKVTCACGNTFTFGSTIESLTVEVCSNCHPFYTGQDKLMDKVGRVQKFKERLEQKAIRQTASKQSNTKTVKTQQAKTVQKGRARVTTKVTAKAAKPTSPAGKPTSSADKK